MIVPCPLPDVLHQLVVKAIAQRYDLVKVIGPDNQNMFVPLMIRVNQYTKFDTEDVRTYDESGALFFISLR